jgi:hypothetical protein
MRDDLTIKLNSTLIKVCALYQTIISDLDKALHIVSSITKDEKLIAEINKIKERNLNRLHAVQVLIDTATSESRQQLLLDEPDSTIH